MHQLAELPGPPQVGNGGHLCAANTLASECVRFLWGSGQWTSNLVCCTAFAERSARGTAFPIRDSCVAKHRRLRRSSALSFAPRRLCSAPSPAWSQGPDPTLCPGGTTGAPRPIWRPCHKPFHNLHCAKESPWPPHACSPDTRPSPPCLAATPLAPAPPQAVFSGESDLGQGPGSAPMSLYQLVHPHLAQRVGYCAPLRNIPLLQLGTEEAPTGFVAISFMHVASASMLGGYCMWGHGTSIPVLQFYMSVQVGSCLNVTWPSASCTWRPRKHAGWVESGAEGGTVVPMCHSNGSAHGACQHAG